MKKVFVTSFTEGYVKRTTVHVCDRVCVHVCDPSVEKAGEGVHQVGTRDGGERVVMWDRDGGQAKMKMRLHKTSHVTLVGKCAKDTRRQLTKQMTSKYLKNTPVLTNN